MHPSHQARQVTRAAEPARYPPSTPPSEQAYSCLRALRRAEQRVRLRLRGQCRLVHESPVSHTIREQVCNTYRRNTRDAAIMLPARSHVLPVPSSRRTRHCATIRSSLHPQTSQHCILSQGSHGCVKHDSPKKLPCLNAISAGISTADRHDFRPSRHMPYYGSQC